MRREKRDIKIFGLDAVVINWLVLVFLAGVVLTGLLLFKEFLYEELNIYGGIWSYVPHFWWTLEVHVYSGIGLLAVGLLHILLNLKNEEVEIMPRNPAREIKGIIHTMMYILFLAQRDEMGSHGKYKGNQRIAYICFVFILGALGMSAILLQFEFIGEMAPIIHLVLGHMLVLLVIYRALLHLRKRDTVLFKAYFLTGKLPEWYVRKYHYLWYKELIGRVYVNNLPAEEEPAEELDGEQADEKIIEEEVSIDTEVANEVAV